MSQYPQLDAAFKALLQQGVSEHQIKVDARAQGWNDVEIDAALASVAVPASSPIPESPVQKPSTQQTKRSSKVGVIIALIMVLILASAGGFLAWAYVTAFNPFVEPPYTEDNLLSQYLEKMESIQSGEWTVRVDVHTEDRDEGALPFNIEAQNYEEFVERYGRDYERLNTLTDILSSLRYLETERYPSSLQELISVNSETSWTTRIDPDPLTKQPYVYTANADGTDFTLTATFETDEAIQEMNSSFFYDPQTLKIEGKKVTFTKDSSGYYYISYTPPKPFFETLRDAANMITSDFSVSGKLGVLLTKPQEDDARDTQVQVDAQGDLDDLTYHVNAEMRVVDESFYFIINNLPGPFTSLLPKDQWISWKPGDETELGMFDLKTAEEEFKQQEEKFREYRQLFVQIADEVDLIRFINKPKRERVDGEILYRYELQLHKASFLAFYSRLTQEVQKDPELGEFLPFVNEATQQLLEGETFSDTFDYYTNNTALTVWVSEEGVPTKVLYSLRVVPPDTNKKMADKQVKVILELGYDRINEDIVVSVPEGAQSYEEYLDDPDNPLAQARMAGQDAVVQVSINNARAQAEIYGSQIDGSVNYDGVCADAMMVSITDSITESVSAPYCHSTSNTWVLAAPLKSEGYYCVDSSGYSKRYQGELITSGEQCP